MYQFSKIEKKWAKKWFDTNIYEPDLNKAKKPFYNLMMFPYLSAEGLHVGNMYAFTGSDIYGRFQRMHGKDVFEPIGLDGFGIHSENYALKIGTHPMDQAMISEKNFYNQLRMIGNGFAWNERIETYKPEYYRWTQWVFIQMWKKGLVERKKASVNWCPSCKTVLADEQVIDGKCERCESEVTKKELEQWFFKITKYAERLLRNLEKIDWPSKVKIAQKNWIGKSEGYFIEFPIVGSKNKLGVFTTRPDTLFGATYMVLAPEHPFIDEVINKISNKSQVQIYIKKSKTRTENERIAIGKAKTGVELNGIKAINPATKKEIPVWIADYVLSSYGAGAIMAVPAHDYRDFEFAKKNNLNIQPVVLPTRVGPGVEEWASKNKAGGRQNILDFIRRSVEKKESAYTHRGELINSGEFNGMKSDEAMLRITKKVGGRREVHYHLRDWLISRQRYWGAPIPMVYCEKCNWQPVLEKDLPVLLPRIKDFRPKGADKSPLTGESAFYKTKCPNCDGPARRETDVSDTFLDSSWYFLRYPDVDNKKQIFSKSRIKKWLPVDMYIGGAEHSVLHLLYSRFVTMVFKDAGLIDFDEPYKTFRAHGLLVKDGAKMSKSKGNVVNPDEYVKKFGADAVRIYLMFVGPFGDGGDWRDAGIMGTVRFLDRVWKIGSEAKFVNKDKTSPFIHRTIKKVTRDIEELKYNTAISELMTLLNRFEKEERITKKDFETFLLLLAPFTPFVAEELWEKLGNKYSIHKHTWPSYDKKYLIRDTIQLIIQVNGKVRATIECASGISEEDAVGVAINNPAVVRHVEKRKIRKTIFVKDRLINFVI
jgi:leucyl-tRNA synthetase